MEHLKCYKMFSSKLVQKLFQIKFIEFWERRKLNSIKVIFQSHVKVEQFFNVNRFLAIFDIKSYKGRMAKDWLI